MTKLSEVAGYGPLHRSLESVRSYYFRAHCAQIDRDQREYGGRSLDDYTLEDFRIIFAAATSQAIAWKRSALRPWRAK
jgi:hypothetical protein